jgi:hypothetical protein
MDHTQDEVLLLLGEVRSDVKKLLRAESDQEGRIRKLETRQWVTAGASAVLSVFAVKIGLPFLPH